MDGYGTNTVLFISRFFIMFFMRKFKNIIILIHFLIEYHGRNTNGVVSDRISSSLFIVVDISNHDALLTFEDASTDTRRR